MATQQLVMAVHTMEAATAKVPFSMILLLDFAKRKATPQDHKCRMVIPSDGVTSVSLWDTTDSAALQEWLADNLGDCSTDLHEVQEDFTYGLSLELARMRAAEKVVDGSSKMTSKAAERMAAGVSTAQQKLDEWDQRTGVISSAKETTAAIQQRVVGAVSRAREDERVKNVLDNMSTGVSSGWAKVSNWVGARIQDINLNDGAEDYGMPIQQHGQAYMPGDYDNDSTESYGAAHITQHGSQQQQQPGGRDHSSSTTYFNKVPTSAAANATVSPAQAPGAGGGSGTAAS
eukprot:GHRR01001854.1.p1 GENE.GHRR01001854.1~~GHRR01001854.1.p1  ORF type:complete len:288 (+),score=133.51 GHRR01001854.1:102-965(+)